MKKLMVALLFLYPLCLFAIDKSKLQEVEQEFNNTFSNSYSISWENTEVAYSFYYEGSDIPEGYLTLYSNGVAVLESRMLSKGFAELKKEFFLYSIENDLITFKLIDTRYITIKNSLEDFQFHVEKKDSSAVSVDFEKKTVTSRFEEKSFLLRICLFYGIIKRMLEKIR